MRTALIFELEALLFDTCDLRAYALQEALAQEGVTAAYGDVQRAHAGRPAALALQHLASADSLDEISRDLVVRRAADAVTASMARGAPSFDTHARDALVAAAAEFPLAVVTCASREDAQHLLALADLDACVTTIRSLAAAASDEQHTVWADARRRLHADHGVALAPAPLLDGARRAGLTTVHVGADADDHTFNQADARLVSLAQVDASFVASLFRTA
jgi:beta-phosphoglucomutase-like phosphatase (HAD superfamily)